MFLFVYALFIFVTFIMYVIVISIYKSIFK